MAKFTTGELALDLPTFFVDPNVALREIATWLGKQEMKSWRKKKHQTDKIENKKHNKSKECQKKKHGKMSFLRVVLQGDIRGEALRGEGLRGDALRGEALRGEALRGEPRGEPRGETLRGEALWR